MTAPALLPALETDPCCGLRLGAYRCEREPGHDGLHRGTLPGLHGPFLWRTEASLRRCPTCGHALIEVSDP